MHDIDSVRLEAEADSEFDHETDLEMESPTFETEEEALAGELLGVNSEEELDQFFGKLFKSISQNFKKAASFLNRHGGPLAEALKGVAKSALPSLGAALGTAIPIPGVGTAVGNILGDAASQLLEAESEEENPEEHEYEVSRQLVRLAANTVRHGARMPLLPNRRAGTIRALRSALHQVRADRNAFSRLAGRRRRQFQRLSRPYGTPGYASRPYGPANRPYGPAHRPYGYARSGYAPAPYGYAPYAYRPYRYKRYRYRPYGYAQAPYWEDEPIGPPPPAEPLGAIDPGPSGNGAMEPAPDPNASGTPDTISRSPAPPMTPSGPNANPTPTSEYEGQDYESDGYTDGYMGGPRGGQWVRRGRKIILYGL